MKKYLTFFLCLLLSLSAYTQKPADKDFPPMFPFVISYDGPDNASSVAHLIEAPAGKHGFIRVEDAANTKLFTGFPDGRTIALGDASLAVGQTRLNWTTVSLVSRQATGFGGYGW